MNKVIITLGVLVLWLVASLPAVEADEILLKNGNKLDYGPTWEKSGMVWFYFHDNGVVGITKSFVVDQKGFLGTVEGNNFVSKEYKCEISIPSGWFAANAVQALDVMPLGEAVQMEYKALASQELMKKMGFLVTIYQREAWDRTTYNPNVIIKVEDQDMYPGVESPLDYLKQSELLMKTIYKNFTASQQPEPFILNNIPSAKQKISCDLIVNGKPFNITQWQYAFIRNKKIYLVAALNTTENFRETEPLFLKTIKSFQFIN